MSGAQEATDSRSRLWALQLAREYQEICRLYRLSLKPPVFEIRAERGRAGCWSPDFAILGIAAWLIEEHAWEVVLEVLKHEIGHQYVWQVMGRGREAPHGPAFQEACDRLGVHPAFRAAQGEIPRLLKMRPTGAKPAGILGKVEKLFALADSANRHEAALAMQKANALLRKHNLERLDIPSIAADYDYLVLRPPGRRLAAHYKAIAGILGDFFYVLVVINRQFSVASGEVRPVLELTGRRENLAVAEHVYHFLLSRLEALWQDYRQRHRAPARLKNSFRMGVLEGFRAKLAEQEAAAVKAARSAGQVASGGGVKSAREAGRPGGQSESAAAAWCGSLICAADPGLIRYYRARYPRLRTVSSSGPRLYRDSYAAGAREGRRLNLHKGVSEAAGNRGFLLEG